MRERGAALVAVLFVAMLLEGVVLSLMMYSQGQLKYTYYQSGYFEAYENALSGLHYAQVWINASAYDAGPEGDHNRVLYNADPDPTDGQPGSGYLVSSSMFTDPPGEFYVKVNRIADRWYELLAYGFRGMGTSDEVKVLIKLRVRERDFFSRYNLFAENGWVVADDTNHWYGKVHSNNYIGFRNRMTNPRETLTGFDWQGNYYENREWDKGTRFYAQVTSTQNPRNYAERGGRDDAWFAISPDFRADEMEFPEVATLADMGAKARDGANVVHDDNYGTVYIGPKGVSIVSKGSTKLYPYIKFINKEGQRRRVRITVKRKHGWSYSTWWETGADGIELPDNGIIHSEDDIKGLEGELNGRVTVVSEKGEVLISDDIWYEDDNDNKAVIYDESNPGGDNFYLNSNYDGNSCLGVMAASNVFLVNNNGYARGDRDLILCGVFAAGVGGDDMNGSFSWLPWDWERNGIDASDPMRDLRVYGSMLSDGNSATGLAHWKGYTYWGGHGGFNSSVFRYDFNLLNSPPPDYMQINMPKYSGWQIVKGG